MGRNQKKLGAILKNSLLVECFMACKDLPQKQFLCIIGKNSGSKSTLGNVIALRLHWHQSPNGFQGDSQFSQIKEPVW
jgi:ABC-type uncharacterized transport system ATPase component